MLFSAVVVSLSSISHLVLQFLLDLSSLHSDSLELLLAVLGESGVQASVLSLSQKTSLGLGDGLTHNG